MEVSAPPGTVVGTVQQVWSICCPSFVIKGPHGDIILRIEGPFCTRSICGSDVEFKVKSADGKVKVGKISKQWSGLIREALTDADFFGITFPIDLDIRMKAVMLGACFLIVYAYLIMGIISLHLSFYRMPCFLKNLKIMGIDLVYYKLCSKQLLCAVLFFH